MLWLICREWCGVDWVCIVLLFCVVLCPYFWVCSVLCLWWGCACGGVFTSLFVMGLWCGNCDGWLVVVFSSWCAVNVISCFLYHLWC